MDGWRDTRICSIVSTTSRCECDSSWCIVEHMISRRLDMVWTEDVAGGMVFGGSGWVGDEMGGCAMVEIWSS